MFIENVLIRMILRGTHMVTCARDVARMLHAHDRHVRMPLLRFMGDGTRKMCEKL